MPQIFQVLCCYKCEMFQVHQVKKSNKWQCRVCNEKQSLKKAFKIGSSRDCRFLVQKLNIEKAGYVEEENEESEVSRSENSLFESENMSSELLDYTEKENFPCSFGEDSETVNSPLLEDNRTSHSNSSICEFFEENAISYKSDFLSKNTRLLQVSPSVSDCQHELSQEGISRHEVACGQSISENVHKHSLETQACDAISPPLKKNRGFQLILKAASKLN